LASATSNPNAANFELDPRIEESLELTRMMGASVATARRKLEQEGDSEIPSSTIPLSVFFRGENRAKKRSHHCQPQPKPLNLSLTHATQ